MNKTNSAKITQRTLTAQKTKKKISNAAMSLFNKHDINDVRIADICQQAGVSVGLFYHYFKSKDDLIFSAFKDTDNYYTEEVKKIPDDLAPLEKLRQFWDICNTLMLSYPPDTIKSLYRLPDDINPPLDTSRPIFKIIAKFLQEAQDNNDIKADINCQELAITIYDCWSGILYRYLYYPQIDLKNCTEKMLQIIYYGIKN